MSVNSPYSQNENTDEVIANEEKDLTALQSLIPRQGEQTPQINTSNITAQQFLSPNEIEAYNQFKEQQPQAFTGALPLNQYYPDAGAPIQHGGYSGSWKGGSINATIYAPGGGLIPLGMMDARDAAVQKAALQKAKEVDDFRKQFQKGPELSKLTNINKSLTDEYFKFHGNAWSSALKKAGGDPNKAKDMLQNNPDFLAKDKAFQVLAKDGNAVVDRLATLQHSLDTGNYLASPALKEAMDKVKNTMNPDSPDFKYLSNAVMRLDADREFSDASNEALAKVVSSKTGKDYDLSNAESYKTFKKDLEFIDEGAKQAVKDNLKRIYANSSLYSPEYIDKNVNGMLGWKKTSEDLNVSAKPQKEDGYDASNVVSQSAENVVSKGQTVNSYTEHYVPTNSTDQKKELRFSISKDMTSADGSPITENNTGYLKGFVQGVGVKPYYKKEKRFLTDEEVKVMKDRGTYETTDDLEMKPAVIFNVSSPKLEVVDENGNTTSTPGEQKTVYFDTDKLAGVFKNPKASGVDYNDMIKKTESHAQELNTKRTATPKQASAPKKSIKESDISAKAKASGYSDSEYKALLQQKGIDIVK